MPRHVHRMRAADLSDLVCGQFGIGMLLTSRRTFRVEASRVAIPTRHPFRVGLRKAPPFRMHIPHVIALRAKKQMIGPDAQWRVAVMQTEDSRQDRAIGQLVSKAMCRHLARGAYTKRTIPIISALALPDPTRFCRAHLCPETRGKERYRRFALAITLLRAVVAAALLDPRLWSSKC